ncbi:Serine/threonine-protein kinase pim-1 [Bagarius yarrelli]|uniref:non-specific serine/threonine protein kinase n=1 Tax=Bagarius yarrelli TaxID=175774 RepID=A0A556V974_BAGYA|nr:Serine/threonine-protein kinase pim-1 [Bagarius yarrelli]
MVSQPPCCSNIVELLEWFDLPYQFVMILEHPSPCMDLNQFARLQNGRLTEAQTRGIMLQVIRAAHHCCERGVLHRDIKAQNLLINTNTMQVKLIDFGCGEVLKDTPYLQYSGTPAFRPPEWVMFKQYNGIPATVWGLGILMYNLLYGEYPFKAEHFIDMGQLKLIPPVSQDCFDLMMWCLELNPELRPTFQDLLQHEWFTDV